MTVYQLFMIVAIILMVLSAVPIPSRVNLFNLAWACVLIAITFGGGALVLR